MGHMTPFRVMMMVLQDQDGGDDRQANDYHGGGKVLSWKMKKNTVSDKLQLYFLLYFLSAGFTNEGDGVGRGRHDLGHQQHEDGER